MPQGARGLVPTCFTSETHCKKCQLVASHGCPICLDDNDSNIVELCVGVRKEEAGPRNRDEHTIHGVCRDCLPLYARRNPTECLICRSHYDEVYEKAVEDVNVFNDVQPDLLAEENEDDWIVAMTRAASALSGSEDLEEDSAGSDLEYLQENYRREDLPNINNNQSITSENEESSSGSDDDDIISEYLRRRHDERWNVNNQTHNNHGNIARHFSGIIPYSHARPPVRSGQNLDIMSPLNMTDRNYTGNHSDSTEEDEFPWRILPYHEY